MPKTATKPAGNSQTAAEEVTEQFRQLVIAARTNPEVGPEAEECLARLNELHASHPEFFTEEDARSLNVLRGYLGVRLAAHGPKKAYEKKAKRKGDKLDHCWRCQSPVDERFTVICATCDSKEFHWMVCPVCKACGCQKTGKALV